MKNKIILGLTMLLFFNSSLFAEEESKPSLGLSVSPGGMMLQKVKLGEEYDIYGKSGVALTIENKDNSPHTYIIRALKPSETGNKKWLKGYAEIPDANWFWVEKNEVLVEAQSKEEVKMYLKIPAEDKYYNQRWTVSLEVKGKSEPGRVLSLAVYPRYQIETESKSGLKEKPCGAVGLEPNTLIFENIALKNKEKKKLTVYNNDIIPHCYTINSEVINLEAGREQIFPSPGYSWIPNPKWVKISPRQVKVMPGESKELTITANIPQKEEYYKKKWESLIFVEEKQGQSGFVRTQIETAGK